MSIESLDKRISDACKWFEGMGLRPDEIVRNGKLKGLPVSLIERAMVVVAEEYKPGDRTRDLAWKVWRIAQEARSAVYSKQRDRFQNKDDRIRTLTYQLQIAVGYGTFATVIFTVIVLLRYW